MTLSTKKCGTHKVRKKEQKRKKGDDDGDNIINHACLCECLNGNTNIFPGNTFLF